MSATFFMLELRVSDWRRSLAWYRDVLGLAVEMTDEENGFALLGAGPTRVSLKEGVPEPGSTLAYFRVEDLDAFVDDPSRVKRNAEEDYRRLILRDPDGHRIGLFEQ